VVWYGVGWKQNSPVLVASAADPSSLAKRLAAAKQKQRTNNLFINCVKSMLSKPGAPVFLMGKPTFSGNRRGFRAAATWARVRLVANHFFVVLVDEYKTSQTCPTCLHPLRECPTVHFRSRKCTGGCQRSDKQGPLIVNKDRSAALCFTRIFLCYLTGIARPRPFTRPVPAQRPTNQDQDMSRIAV